jgi:ABC-type antimicrobial peptide transport system permease subunit
MLKSQPVRLAMTISGISLCIILMLFLLGIYNGVADGSVEYVRKNEADLWVIQKSAENILRGTSILNTLQYMQLLENEKVASVSPVLLVLSTLKKNERSATIFLCGYNISSPLGGPPEVISGRGIKKLNEIVLDKAFARKNRINPGDKVTIMDDTLEVTGFSTGTNAFVIQYGFTAVQKVHSIIGYRDIYTCFLIKLSEGVNLLETKEELAGQFPGCSFYTHREFINNNIKEMKSGILPMLYSIAGISAVVLTTILSLILSISILEKKKDFAVMKTLGCPGTFLPRLVFTQAFIIILLSCAAGVLLYFPLSAFMEMISPEINVKNDLFTSSYVIAAAMIMGLVSSFIAVQRLRHIYPVEVF